MPQVNKDAAVYFLFRDNISTDLICMRMSRSKRCFVPSLALSSVLPTHSLRGLTRHLSNPSLVWTELTVSLGGEKDDLENKHIVKKKKNGTRTYVRRGKVEGRRVEKLDRGGLIWNAVKYSRACGFQQPGRLIATQTPTDKISQSAANFRWTSVALTGGTDERRGTGKQVAAALSSNTHINFSHTQSALSGAHVYRLPANRLTDWGAIVMSDENEWNLLKTSKKKRKEKEDIFLTRCKALAASGGRITGRRHMLMRWTEDTKQIW